MRIAAPRIARPCLSCGKGTTKGSRCPACAQAFARAQDVKRGTAKARGYGWAWTQLSDAILERDDYTCYYPGCTRVADTADHIIPKAHGGSDDPSNLRAACRFHNSQRGGQTRGDGAPKS